jgi:hypothetical protein
MGNGSIRTHEGKCRAAQQQSLSDVCVVVGEVLYVALNVG